MSDRIFAVAWLGVCGLIVVQMWGLDVPFAYEPVGPKAFPILLAGLMALCCIVLIARPDADTHRPNAALVRKGALLIGTLLFYATLFSSLGFSLSTTAMAIVVSRVFGGSWLSSVVSGLAIGIIGFVIFDRLLDVSLPLGSLWS